MRSRREIQQQVIDGLNLSFDPSTSITLYLRACERLLREARSAQAEEDHEQAYFILLRLFELLVNYIPRHPSARDAIYRAPLQRWRNQLPKLITDLDVLKAVLDADYELYLRKKRADTELKKKQEAIISAKRKERDVQLQKSSNRPIEYTPRRKSSPLDHDALQKRFQSLQVDQHPVRSPPQPAARIRDYTYPNLDQSPPKSTQSFHLPTRPPKLPGSPNQVKIDSSPVIEEQQPEYQFVPSAQLENGQALKTVFVPGSLRAAFLKLAEPNTMKNLETCGILSGQLKNGAYFITTLIIPAQASTSDTCHTTDEESLFNYQDSHDLFTIGWIHTHPSQTCFLSSVDVHTHCSYQLMLPEAIAIVLAPSKTPDWGAFRLTDPPGMQAVRDCRQTGLFHPHDETNIYVDATNNMMHGNAGHLKELGGMSFKIVDQRK